ncbi:hypothetical protein GN244_ATG11714 [Phytophthora infestans]|uniref:Uncharacterized protein n=1 Tax=Phytophthora infestans TaxID=4787 RepID=A0A833SQX0_PHYIN|nr:hypothetical protein GN244_ATG11714 [Phytophthora infestans]
MKDAGLGLCISQPHSVATINKLLRVICMRAEDFIQMLSTSAGYPLYEVWCQQKQNPSPYIELTSRNGPEPILSPGEVSGVVKAVTMRTRHVLCFTKDELGLFIRNVVENSSYSREIPEIFLSKSYIQRFVVKHSVDFSSRRAQSLEVCRAKVSTVENVDRHYNNLKELLSSVADIPTSRIWNLDETGMCPQTRSSTKKVLDT